MNRGHVFKNRLLIVFSSGQEPIPSSPSSALRIWTSDLDLCAAAALSAGCRLRLPASLLSPLSEWTEKKRGKREHRDPQRRDQRLFLYTTARDYGTLWHFIVYAWIISLSCAPFSPALSFPFILSSFFCPFLPPVFPSHIHPSLISHFGVCSSPSFLFICPSLTSSSSPSSLASYLNCSAHEGKALGRTPCWLNC